jgi:pimeloyl-ACP methyl ester carboxylesterase
MTHDIVQTSAEDTLPPFDQATFRAQFRHDAISIKGVRLHFVEGGSGAPILLVPGWPQSWYAWRYVMPLITAAGRRVIALDPRGMGDSDRPASGYEMQTIAADLHGFAEALGLTAKGPIDVVGHDIGAWIGYFYAAEWPDDVKRLAVFDAAIPGITPPPPAGFPTAEVNVKTWHFAFNRLDDLPEILLQGREREFLTWLFRAKSTRPWTITSADLDEYVPPLERLEQRFPTIDASWGLTGSPIVGRAPSGSSPFRYLPSARKAASAQCCSTQCASSRLTCVAGCSKAAGTTCPRRRHARSPNR